MMRAVTATNSDPAPPGSVVAHIRARMPALTPRGRRIGQTILDNPLDVIHLTVSDLAERTETSVATVVRFCQDVGLRGFTDLKIRLAAETIPPERGLHEDVQADDLPSTILTKVLASTATAVTAAADTVNPAAFTRAVELLRDARQLLCIGVGTSAPLAQDAGYRFRTAGLPAEAPPDAHVQHVTARLLSPGAVCLCFSHTGQTRESLGSINAARQAGAATIAITSFFNSPLTELVDVALVAGSRETDFRVEAITSRIAHIAVLDALYVAVFLSNIDRARTAQQLSADALTEHRI
jgi:DNA-binding MurR/RpiR family transcriptional regulator